MRWRVVLAWGVGGGLVVAASWSMAASAPASTQVSTSTSSSGTTTISGMAVLEAPVFGTGAISGVVTDGTTGAPLEGALVGLGGGRPHAAGRPQQMTDARGRFLFTHLSPSPDYQVTALKLGYLDGGYKRLPGIAAIPRIALRDGEWFSKADFQLWRTSSMTGTVLDELNEPVVGVPVRALVKVRVAGRVKYAAGPTTQSDDRGMYRLSGLSPGEYIVHVPSVQVTTPVAAPTPRPPAAQGSGVSVTSSVPDPDGVLRIENGLGLSVGFFATPPAGGGAAAYAMAYHPASRSMDAATPITLQFGDQRQNVDVQLTLLPTVRVSGQVIGPVEAVAKVPVRLLPVGSESLGLGAEAAFTTTDAAGNFNFLRVPSGDYTLLVSRSVSEFSPVTGVSNSTLMPRAAMLVVSMQASSLQGAHGVSLISRSAGGPPASGRVNLSVADKDVDDVVIDLNSAVRVSGHFLWDGDEWPPDGRRLDPTVRLEPADGDLSLGLQSRETARGSNEIVPVPVPLAIEGVLPGRYVFGNLSTGGFFVEAIEWRGRDLLRTPLEVDGNADITGVIIRMTSKTNTVTGTVRIDGGVLATSGAVMVFPGAPSAWRAFGLSALLFKIGPIAADGTYVIPNLVPGEYLVAAVPDSDRTRWIDADFLASIVGLAARIQVTPGSKVAQNLQMIGGGR